ncbi:TonB-dependent receptor [Novosphingobium sp. YJ-S2-02]|uniref:TonB-dependent receptor n=1 Tax=Novosphingobium aureum TaxID=2792964 RepID=A0A931HDK3_9SPHN|nr:TonB-dependent receptor [Novosphingobium aureum]MBH0113809.1 TonB-dependent receptor [Novosphingobium aureum]
MTKSHISTMALTTALAFAASANTAQAQEPAATNQINEIVVTAEKRESTAQKTPIAMTVATGDELIKNGVSDVNGLTAIAPTLGIAQNNQNTIITIRGVSSRDYTETGNPAVAVSIDNFYLQNGTALNVGFFDLERIEVLRGPQGTLYGRNSTAGAINISTAKPTDQLEGSMALEYGYKNLMIAEGMLNVPLGGGFAMRGAFSVHQRDPYRDNGSLASTGGAVTKGGNDDVSQAMRLHLAYDDGGALTGLITGEYTHVGGVGAVIKGIPYEDVKADGTLDIGDDRQWELDHQGFIDLDIKNVRANLNYDFGPVTLSYYGGYRNQRLRRDNDQDGGTAFQYGFPTDQVVETQNHELRVSTNGTGPFGMQAGLYYFWDKGDSLTNFQVHGLGGTVPFNFYEFDYLTTAKSYAAFAQAYYEITPDLKIEAGARYTEEKKHQVGYSDIAGTYTDVDARYSGSKDTYHLGINWQATPTNLVYAKVDTGFKAGGFQNGFTYGPETITAYEAGVKNRFLGNTLQVNLSAFLYDYTNLQVQQNDPETAISRIFNAGTARIYGGELETNWQPTMADKIDFTVAYLHARYTDFVNNGVQYADNTLPQAPDWAISGGYSHDFYIGEGTLTARVQSRFQSKSYFSFRNFDTEMQDSYTKTDLMLTYVPSDSSPFEVSAYVRNIEDTVILTTSEEAGYAGGYLVQFADPRTWGARVTYRF